MEVDPEILISLVESKPVLWDKTLDIYKDRVATKNAWKEVCLALKSDFDNFQDAEKNSFGKDVIRKWTNLRDSYKKSKKDDKDAKKSGSGARKRKAYLFSDQMHFLNKVYTANNTVDSLDSEIEPGLTSTLDNNAERGSSAEGTSDTNVIQTKTTRKHKKPDEVELRLLKALETTPCSKMSFLQSLMPHLQKYNENEFLQFQIGVLKVIEKINKMPEATTSHPQNQLSSSCLSQPHDAPQSHPSVIHQQSSSHHYIQGSQIHSNPAHNTSVIARQNTRPETTQSTSQYLHGFCYSDSSQSEQLQRSYPPSLESTYSDDFEFGPS